MSLINSSAVVRAFRMQKSLAHPYHLMRASRIGVVNRYKYVSKSALVNCFACRITLAMMNISRET